ncbi:MAG: nuclear transport factor 2 family protein [Chlorobiaceae bacterium]|nr:nuclear transport factor 2 family protein [Chlorobiaceae bacterium]
MLLKKIPAMAAIFMLVAGTLCPARIVAAPPALDEAMVKNVLLGWFAGTNDHKPVAQLLPYLADDVQMYYPDNPKPFTGKQAFSAWYADALVRYFDETHKLESIDIKIEGRKAKVTLVVRWERRVWSPGEAQSRYEAYLSHQRVELEKSATDGRVLITKKIVDAFEKTAPLYQPES